MKLRPYRILCVGNESDLLTSRCAVLATSSYETEALKPLDAEPALRARHFDLVILCTTLTKQERNEIRGAVSSGTKVLALDSFIRPEDLLSRVANLVGESSAPL
jgi:hypothetical protein